MSTPNTESDTTALQLHGVEIVDTFAEAFPIKATRLIITADSDRWAKIAGTVSPFVLLRGTAFMMYAPLRDVVELANALRFDLTAVNS